MVKKGGWVKRALLGLAVLLLVVLVLGAVWFRGSLRTLATLRRPDPQKPFYTLSYGMDYGLDELLKQGVSSDRELLDFLMARVLKGLPYQPNTPDIGCATFVAGTPEGQRLFGRNFDLFYSPAMLVETRPEQGYASLSLVNLSFLGFDAPDKLPGWLLGRVPLLAAPYVPLDGVNEKGLAVGVLMIEDTPTSQQTGRTKILTTVAMRMLLDRAATVEEAVALLEQYDMQAVGDSSYHFHIADAKGGSVVVEYLQDEMVVVPADKATNFLLAPNAPREGGQGRERYAILEERLAQTGGILTAQQAMGLLDAAHSTPDMWPDQQTQTQWSAVYNLTHPGVTIAVGMEYDQLFDFTLE